jgi:prevent-host-death family protein
MDCFDGKQWEHLPPLPYKAFSKAISALTVLHKTHRDSFYAEGNMAEQINDGRRAVSKTELRRNLNRVIQELQAQNAHTMIESDGAPVAVLMSIAEYQRLSQGERKVRFNKSESRQIALMPLVLADIEREARGIELIYALDFCELYHHVVPQYGRVETVIEYYLNHLGHTMVVLPPTVLEMLSTLDGLSAWYRRAYHPKADTIDQFLHDNNRRVKKLLEKVRKADKAGDIWEIWDDFSRLKTNDRLILSFLLDDTRSEEALGAPGQKLEQLFESGRLRLQDIEWQDFDEDLFSEAYHLFKDRRPTSDKRFANRVDAMNTAIISALNRKHTLETGGKYFSLVTHGSITEAVWSGLTWNEDPFLRQVSHIAGLISIPYTRGSDHCAYHAYFDSMPDSLQAARSHLAQREEIQELLQREARLSRSEIEQLQLLQKHCASVDEAIKSPPPRIRLYGSLLERQPDRMEVESVLKKQTSRFMVSAKETYEIVETAGLNKYPSEIIDHTSQEIKQSIISSSSDPLKPLPKEEKLIAKARLLVSESSNRRLYVGKKYQMEIQIQWRTPEGVHDTQDYIGPSFKFDIAVDAQDMEVEPSQRTCAVARRRNSQWLIFTLTPTEPGENKRVLISIYYNGYFVGLLEFERDVVEKGIQLKQQTVSPAPPLTIDRKELSIAPEYDRQPIEVRLHFSQTAAKGIEFTVIWKGQSKSITSNLLEQDVSIINRQMQDRIEEVARAHGGIGVLDKPKSKILEDLASKGYQAYNRLFPDQADKDFIQHILTGDKPITISITSRAPLFPLGLIYDRSLEEELDYEHFWGMRYIIWRDIISHRPTLDPEILIAGVPRVALVPNMTLVHVREREVRLFLDLERRRKIALLQWESLAGETRDRKRDLSRFLSAEFEIAHFACHVDSGLEKDPDLTYIMLDDNFHISTEELETFNVRMKGNPLVVLNACQTSVKDPLHSFNLATVIQQECGGRGVVATEARVPDAFGAEFTEQLYRRLVEERKGAGESLLEVTRYFLREKGNPLGLLYTLYGPAGITLVQKGSTDNKVS